jgi:hypothetical protein
VSGNKFRMALGLPVGAVVNCADNTGECLLLRHEEARAVRGAGTAYAARSLLRLGCSRHFAVSLRCH